MRRKAQQPTLYPTALSQSSHLKIDNKTNIYKTPEKFLKQIRQRTFDCNSNLPDSKELKCAVQNRVVGKMMKSLSTSGTMSQIMNNIVVLQVWTVTIQTWCIVCSKYKNTRHQRIF